MENGKSNEFNRVAYFRQIIKQFINKPTIESVEKEYNQLIAGLDADTDIKNLEHNQIKKTILRDCKDTFSRSYVREAIANAKNSGMSNVDLVSIVTRKLCENILGDHKRHYDMSKLSCANQLSTTKVPKLVHTDGLDIGPLFDLQGKSIYIKHIGTLFYDTISSDDYIFQYRVSKQINKTDIISYEIFSDFLLSALYENVGFREAVIEELFSTNNIELSFANGYVGEICKSEGSIGDEHFDKDPKTGQISRYKYQISPTHALVYDGLVIDAIKAYIRDQEKNSEPKKQDEGR